ncbi:MAG: hypothetical protein ABFC38_13635 [Methanospirillum sp.]
MDYGRFAYPRGIAVDAEGTVYVTDTNNNRTQLFNSTSGHLAAWGESGSGNGQFNYPRGLAADSAGNVYVADTGSHRNQVFPLLPNRRSSWLRMVPVA